MRITSLVDLAAAHPSPLGLDGIATKSVSQGRQSFDYGRPRVPLTHRPRRVFPGRLSLSRVPRDGTRDFAHRPGHLERTGLTRCLDGARERCDERLLYETLDEWRLGSREEGGRDGALLLLG